MPNFGDSEGVADGHEWHVLTDALEGKEGARRLILQASTCAVTTRRLPANMSQSRLSARLLPPRHVHQTRQSGYRVRQHLMSTLASRPITNSRHNRNTIYPASPRPVTAIGALQTLPCRHPSLTSSCCKPRNSNTPKTKHAWRIKELKHHMESNTLKPSWRQASKT